MLMCSVDKNEAHLYGWSKCEGLRLRSGYNGAILFVDAISRGDLVGYMGYITKCPAINFNTVSRYFGEKELGIIRGSEVVM